MTRKAHSTRWLLVAAIALFATAFTGYAQSPHHVLIRHTPAREHGVQPQSMPRVGAQTLATRVFLPLIISSPVVGPLQFSSKEQGSNPSAIFDYGITELFVSAHVMSGAGLQWRTEWTIDGEPEPGLEHTDTVKTGNEVVADGICYGLPAGPGGPIQCGERIPRGTYQVQFFLDDQLYQTGTAVIR